MRLEDPEILNFIQSARDDKSELDESKNSSATQDEEPAWHLIVSRHEKMELYNWKTGKQCLIEESPPVTRIFYRIPIFL